jgi:2,4-dienoyl-CoA reductase-like NADH-dependent reductase (Old Yellow Enzyme family)/thioredoxin reductase
MSEYEALLKPLALKHLTLRNRIMSTAHASGLAEDGMPADRYQRYHEEKAKGGLALTIFGGSSSVAPDSPLTFNQIDISHDRILPHLESFAERIHRHGAAVMVQITHIGRRGSWDNRHWLPLVGPSYTRESLHRSYAKEMEDWDFRRVIRNFADAAERCQKGGLDGCEVIASAHHLIDSFLSPVTNQRQDRYGGSLENRMRFGLEVLTAIRERVGDRFILGIRIAGDELLEGGLDQSECLKVAAGFANSGLIDYLNIYQAHGDNFTGLVTLLPDMSFPLAPFLYLASAVKAEVDLPVFHASAIRDLATAARAVADGHVDMVAMTRAHIADPHLVRKLQEGRADQVRQCIGANYCVDHAANGGVACIQNVATAREATMPHVIPRAATRKRVVVAGGGPGGLEAARVAAARGHEVVLFESTGRLGGQINIARGLGWRESLGGISRWLEQELRRSGVDIRLEQPATPDGVVALSPDIVVVATGGTPKAPACPGGELAVSGWSILAGESSPGSNVLVYDELGLQSGAGVAEFLGARGAQVELATPDRMVAEAIGHTAFVAYLRNLYKHNVVQSPNLRLAQLYAEGNEIVAVLRNEYTGAEEERVVDQVVYELGSQPRDELYHALRPHSRNLGEVDYDALIEDRPQGLDGNPEGRFQLFRVGDAVMGRNIHAAMYDSARILKNL